MTDEAKWVLDNVKFPSCGMFVDVGAFDGLEGSNTLPFEQIGWSGICIEADPLNAWKCAVNRNCKTVCAAIGLTAGIASLKVDLDDRGLSGLERNPSRCREIMIGVERLDRVIQIVMPPKDFRFELLSIDTEGTEIEVFDSIGIYRPRIVIMEWNTLGKSQNGDRLKGQMEGDSYRLLWSNSINMIFESTL